MAPPSTQVQLLKPWHFDWSILPSHALDRSNIISVAGTPEHAFGSWGGHISFRHSVAAVVCCSCERTNGARFFSWPRLSPRSYSNLRVCRFAGVFVVVVAGVTCVRKFVTVVAAVYLVLYFLLFISACPRGVQYVRRYVQMTRTFKHLNVCSIYTYDTHI